MKSGPVYPIFKMRIKYEPDIVTARQKTRTISQILGFADQDRARLSTAVSELARNVFQYAAGGTIDFFFADRDLQTLFICISDNGPGIKDIDSILNGTYVSKSGMGIGLTGSKKLMDSFEIETNHGLGTQITIGKALDRRLHIVKKEELPNITRKINAVGADSAFEEIQNQNRDLLLALEDARLAREELTALNAKLKLAHEEADAANRAKSMFLSNMSHEIRTPLGVILGFADLALDPNSTVSDRDTYLGTVKRNAQNLTNLIGEILDLAKVEAGKINLEKADFSLPTLMIDLVDSLGLKAKTKGVSLTLKFEGSFPDIVESDPTRIQQILLNLVNNALKFTETGTIEVRARHLPEESSANEAMIEIIVTDSGIGIRKENQAHLFEPFMQADSSTTRKFGGTGLGLHLSKHLAEVLGGGLSLQSSDEGVGSTFRFYFRVCICAKTQFRSAFVVNHRDLKSNTVPKFSNELDGMRILLVEDSSDNQFLFVRYLKKAGAHIELASDGLEGVEKAQQLKFDAILMDIQMPNLDGYGATKRLKEIGITTPIIALTAHAMKEERDRALMSGFSDYLIKPLDSQLLIETLVSVCSGPKEPGLNDS
jgi:signal transduction histidine kinase/ActR/RegA family two-component response regulator